MPRSQCCHQFPTSCYLGDIDKSPSHPAVPHGGDASSEAASQAPVHDWNYEPAISETSSQKLREEVQYMSSQVLNSIDWLSPSVVLRIPMYRVTSAPATIFWTRRHDHKSLWSSWGKSYQGYNNKPQQGDSLSCILQCKIFPPHKMSICMGKH